MSWICLDLNWPNIALMLKETTVSSDDNDYTVYNNDPLTDMRTAFFNAWSLKYLQYFDEYKKNISSDCKIFPVRSKKIAIDYS